MEEKRRSKARRTSPPRKRGRKSPTKDARTITQADIDAVAAHLQAYYEVFRKFQSLSTLVGPPIDPLNPPPRRPGEATRREISGHAEAGLRLLTAIVSAHGDSDPSQILPLFYTELRRRDSVVARQRSLAEPIIRRMQRTDSSYAELPETDRKTLAAIAHDGFDLDSLPRPKGSKVRRITAAPAAGSKPESRAAKRRRLEKFKAELLKANRRENAFLEAEMKRAEGVAADIVSSKEFRAALSRDGAAEATAVFVGMARGMGRKRVRAAEPRTTTR